MTLTAVPDADNQFQGWSGDISGTENPTTVVMDTHKTVNAVFNPPVRFQIAVWKVGEGNVSFDPPGGHYEQGTRVQISAEPAEGWTFDHWGGALNGTLNPDSLLMDSDKAINVTFSQDVHVDKLADKLPEYRLNANYPNPFNPVTTLPFTLKKAGLTTLSIYDVLGNKIKVVIQGHLNAGTYKVRFDASELVAGVYFYEIRSGDFSATRNMILMK